MNYLSRLFIFVSILLPMTVWAQSAGNVFLNLYYKNKALYLGQYNKSCTVGSSTTEDGTCVRSVEIKTTLPVRGAFYNAVSEKWVSGSATATQYQSTVLNLSTDIDFGQTLDQNGDCSENHEFLPFPGLTFNGLNKTISNLCRVDKGAISQPVGLFGEISGKTVKNLNISNVYFTVANEYSSGDPASTNAGDYLAVGALAYKISKSEVTNVQLKNVVIQAPLAGGLAGYIEGSTISGVSTAEDSFIQVSNDRQIEDGYIGSAITGINTDVFNSNNPYKVLLGGLAGAAFFTNFKDIDIAIQVENKAAVDLSALGGLVGQYVYAPLESLFPEISERNSEIVNVNIHGYSSGGDYIKPVVSGGTVMGGILGVVRRLDEDDSPITELLISMSTVTNLDIKQSKIKINDVDEKQTLYFGGIVGKADLCNGGILQVKESDVESVNIEESIQGNAAFQYYMGGIAGYASCHNLNCSNERQDLYLTLQQSTASGNIRLSGGYSKTGSSTSNVHTSAVMGGLVGDAVLSLEENGISQNESNVSIAYNAKRASSVDDLDSVLVGGVFGAVSICNLLIDFVRLVDLSYKGLIDIDDDGLSARVGGIVGKFPLTQTGNPKIEFSGMHVEGNSSGTIVSYSGESIASSTMSSSIGGICGMCQTPREISLSSVEGNIEGTSGTNAPPKKDFYVGGLVGMALVMDEMAIKNNYFIGSIADKFSNSAGKGKVGYLFGYLTGDGLGNRPQVTSNFHYGNDNVGAVGYFDNYGVFSNIAYFNEDGFNKFVAKNNVRNGNEAILQNGENGSAMNGYVTGAYMRSRNMAVFLNGPWSDTEDQVWTYENADFPFFGTPAELTYTVSFFDIDENQMGDSQELGFGAAAEAPEVPKITGKCFMGWSKSFDIVIESMDIVALYDDGACKYTVTFNDLDGQPLKNAVAEDGTSLPNPQEVEEGMSAIAPKGPLPTSDGRCFDRWNKETDDYTNVTKDMTISAYSKTCEYTVTFTYLKADGKSKGRVSQTVAHNKAATPPSSNDFPQKTSNGKCFVGWDTDVNLGKITSDLDISAKYETCVSSSSSSKISSSSQFSSSSEISSSSQSSSSNKLSSSSQSSSSKKLSSSSQTSESIQVAKALISGFHIVQMPNTLSIGFDAGSKTSGAKVKVTIMGVDGRVIAMNETVAQKGTNAISMKKPKQGIYFIHLKVGNQTLTSRILKIMSRP